MVVKYVVEQRDDAIPDPVQLEPRRQVVDLFDQGASHRNARLGVERERSDDRVEVLVARHVDLARRAWPSMEGVELARPIRESLLEPRKTVLWVERLERLPKRFE